MSHALAFAGSLSRPLGGALADRIGGTRLLIVLLLAIAAAYGAAISSPSLPVMLGVLGTLFVCLGLGNGAVFQVVPLRFPREVGTVTGLVGAIGGVGGFFLPSLLGAAREGLGSSSKPSRSWGGGGGGFGGGGASKKW
jgi:MFS transporter, NNP family, nitrate/nitrite transporter